MQNKNCHQIGCLDLGTMYLTSRVSLAPASVDVETEI